MNDGHLLTKIKQSIDSLKFKEAIRQFLLLNIYDLDIPVIKRLDKVIKTNLKEFKDAAGDTDIKSVKIAILGNYTFNTLTSAIRTALLMKGFLADIYEGGYGLMEQEIIDPKSAFYAFRPDITLLAVGYRDIKGFPAPGAEPRAVNDMIEGYVDTYRGFWNMISGRTSCHIIQNNFDVPLERPFGELEARYPWTRTNFIKRLNLRLGEAAPGYVSILDVEHLSSRLGKSCWFDDRFYHHSKQPFSFGCMPEYAGLFSSIISAVKGTSKKCLVLDLDNTLWGGVIGDDGIENIRFGQGSGEGESYLEFAQYINSLKERGVILAVCSKNNEEMAKEPFLKIKEMPLGLKDFAVFLANWNDKVTNLKDIARQLNIGLDSLVLVDDDPIEREFVKEFLPMVDVVEMPQDPSLFKRALYQGHYFETTGFSKEDKQRTELYRAKREFEEEKSRFKDIDSFLSSLDMRGTIFPFNEVDISRITQLINKTNQFNLTTRRYSESQVKKFMDGKDHISLAVRLKDRFSDYGLISIFLGLIEESIINIDTWLMSCRVFSRSVEHFLFNRILEDCKRKNIRAIKGVYVPSRKNNIVKDLYKDLGFSLIETKGDGASIWHLDVKADTPFVKTLIKTEVGE